MYMSYLCFSVLDMYSGDAGTERIIFLAPSVGNRPTLIAQIEGKWSNECLEV